MSEKNSRKSYADKISEEITVEVGEENRASSKSDSEYEFVTETIKKKPVNKRRFAKKFAQSVTTGIVTGVVACVVFVHLMPIIQNKTETDEYGHIYIPKDELGDYPDDYPEITETESADNTQNNAAAVTEAVDAGKINAPDKTVLDDGAGSGKDSEAGGSVKEDKADASDGSDESGDATQPAAEVKCENTITVAPSVSIDDYRQLYRKMSEVANIAKRSLVKVKGVTDGTDWFKNNYESATVSTGLIVADNGRELLIITNSGKLTSAKEIEVTFCDSRVYKGYIKKSDSNTNLAAVAVLLNDIEDVTKRSYAMADLGNSMLPTLPGTPVLAIGDPLGIEESMAMGIITSNTKVIEKTDSNMVCITTDIYGSSEGSGVIIDLDGKVLGIIFQGGISSEMKNIVHAYSISDIKSRIEKLSNGQTSAYLGVIGTDVSQYAIDELNVPAGAYVKQVVIDSPAMNGGIQNGDIIVKLGTTAIRSYADYSEAVNKTQPGDRTVVSVKRPIKDEYVEFSYEIILEAIR